MGCHPYIRDAALIPYIDLIVYSMLHDDIDTDLLNASMYTPPLSKETMPATSSTEGTIGNQMSKDT